MNEISAFPKWMFPTAAAAVIAMMMFAAPISEAVNNFAHHEGTSIISNAKPMKDITNGINYGR